MKKKSKILLVIALLLGAAYFVYVKFFAKDKAGGKMTLDAKGNPYYNGKATGGYIVPGTLKMQGGYWVGTGSEGIYQYDPSAGTWVAM